jgi:hypothetical protein
MADCRAVRRDLRPRRALAHGGVQQAQAERVAADDLPDGLQHVVGTAGRHVAVKDFDGLRIIELRQRIGFRAALAAGNDDVRPRPAHRRELRRLEVVDGVVEDQQAGPGSHQGGDISGLPAATEDERLQVLLPADFIPIDPDRQVVVLVMVRGERLGRRRFPDAAKPRDHDARTGGEPGLEPGVHVRTNQPPGVRRRREPADLLFPADALELRQVLGEPPHSAVADEQLLHELRRDLFSAPKMQALALHLGPVPDAELERLRQLGPAVLSREQEDVFGSGPASDGVGQVGAGLLHLAVEVALLRGIFRRDETVLAHRVDDTFYRIPKQVDALLGHRDLEQRLEELAAELFEVGRDQPDRVGEPVDLIRASFRVHVRIVSEASGASVRGPATPRRRAGDR